MDWEAVKRLVGRGDLKTKKTRTFTIDEVSDTTIWIALPSGRQSVSRENLERAEHLVRQGLPMPGPKAYKDLVVDERPTYAWAILHELGVL